jgi:hypothetical protein
MKLCKVRSEDFFQIPRYDFDNGDWASDKLFQKIEVFQQKHDFFLINIGTKQILDSSHFLIDHSQTLVFTQSFVIVFYHANIEKVTNFLKRSFKHCYSNFW